MIRAPLSPAQVWANILLQSVCSLSEIAGELARCVPSAGRFSGHAPQKGFPKKARPKRADYFPVKNRSCPENPARFLRQVSYTGLEFFRKERRQCQTVRIPGATWMTSSSIRKTAGQASDKRKPCGNAGPHRQFFFFCLLNAESAKAVHGFLDFLFRGCFCGTPLN